MSAKKSSGRPKRKAPFPSRQQVLDYIAENPRASGKRDIARAFGLTGEDRVALRDLLRELKAEGLLESKPRRGSRGAGHLPSVTVIEVLDVDEDGYIEPRELIGKIHKVKSVRKAIADCMNEGNDPVDELDDLDDGMEGTEA